MSETPHGEATLQIVNELYDRGIRRMTVLMRHGARYYDLDNPQNEAYQTLTDEGKAQAYAYGLRLPDGPVLRFFSSPLGRCIETAYQVEKACIQRGIQTEVNQVAPHLVTFFINNGLAFMTQLIAEGTPAMLKAWFAGSLSKDLLLSPEDALGKQIAPILDGFRPDDGPQIDICVTHDWNLYLIREMCLSQHNVDVGRVDYLEGIVFYKLDGVVQAKNHLGTAKTVTAVRPQRHLAKQTKHEIESP